MRIDDGLVVLLRVIDSSIAPADDATMMQMLPNVILDQYPDSHDVSRQQVIRFRVSLINTNATPRNVTTQCRHHFSSRTFPPIAKDMNVFSSGDAFRSITRKDGNTFTLQQGDWITSTSAVDHGWTNFSASKVGAHSMKSFDITTYFTYQSTSVKLKCKNTTDKTIEFESRPMSLTFIDNQHLAKQIKLDTACRRRPGQSPWRNVAPNAPSRFRLCVTLNGSVSNFVHFNVQAPLEMETSIAGRAVASAPASTRSRSRASAAGMAPKELFPNK